MVDDREEKPMTAEEDILYRQVLEKSVHDFQSSSDLNESQQRSIIQRGKNQARMSNILITLAILLLFVPVLTLGSYLYYSVGGRANTMIDVINKTIYITEPNTSMDEMRIHTEVGLFSMNVDFDVFKRVGKKDIRIGDYSIHLALNQVTQRENHYTLETPIPAVPYLDNESLFHPDAPITYNPLYEWEILEGLSDETVSELYISLDKTYTLDEVKKKFGTNLDITWVAVDTGLEATQKDKGGQFITPIGFPVDSDSDMWSPFNSSEDHEKQFMDIVKLLSQHEELATQVSKAKSLALSERLAYLNANGIRVYGLVVTGPTGDLKKLQNDSMVRAMKVGEVRLWNWHS